LISIEDLVQAWEKGAAGEAQAAMSFGLSMIASIH
jgi:hypothetical protein